jgi:hypothetical protein
MKKSASIAMTCVAFVIAGSNYNPIHAEDVFPTDSQTLIFHFKETTISIPKTQNGLPSIVSYTDSLSARGTESLRYNAPSVSVKSVELIREVNDFYSKFKTDDNGRFKPDEFTIRLQSNLLSRIIGNSAQAYGAGLFARVMTLYPNNETKLELAQRSKGYGKWFDEVIKPKKPDELNMVTLSFEEVAEWRKHYQLPNYVYGLSRVSVEEGDFTPFGEPLVFDSSCSQDLTPLVDHYGLCRLGFYWRSDMFITYDFDSVKIPREKWRTRIQELYSTLRYLEQKK